MRAFVTSLLLLALGVVAGGCSCSTKEQEVQEVDWGTGAGKQVASKMAEREGVEGLAKLLGSESTVVRMRAITALGTLKNDPEATQLLLNVVSNSKVDNDIHWAIVGLATQGASQAKEIIQKTLKGDKPYLRQAAVVAIGELGDKSLYPLVFEALDDPDPGVGSTAAHVIERYKLRDK